MRPLNVSIHRKCYQNWFINECARKKNAKIPKCPVAEVFCEMYQNLPS